MQDLIFRIHQPHILLRPYIHRIWIFESPFGIAENDLKLVTPNGEIKLIIMYKSNVRCKIENKVWDFKEQSFAIVGQTTKPSIIIPEGGFGTLGIEFKPIGVYKFINIPLDLLTDQFIHFEEAFEKSGRHLCKEVMATEGINDKIAVIEKYLLNQLYSVKKDFSLIDYAVNEITSSEGRTNIGNIIEQSGYSKRHFDRCFKVALGITPKELASIIRFQSFLGNVTRNRNQLKDQLYFYYYDQSHFIKEFKKYTGLKPGEYFRFQNTFDDTFTGK
jgi:AraC-like DNA-binding protein